MSQAVKQDGDGSPTAGLEAALERVGDRWALRLIDVLLQGPRRFNELAQAVPGLAPNILTSRLRRLERDGLVVALAYSEKPARYEYQVTEDGRQLAGALRLLADWGARVVAAPGEGTGGPRHRLCGTPLEGHWYCPTCQVVTDGEQQDSAWV